MGAVSSRSWLPIVEAPGCLGHSTSFSNAVVNSSNFVTAIIIFIFFVFWHANPGRFQSVMCMYFIFFDILAAVL